MLDVECFRKFEKERVKKENCKMMRWVEGVVMSIFREYI